MNLNKVMLIGRVTKDLELKSTKGGTNVLSFSLAINRTWTGKDGQKQEEVEYVNCVFYGKTAQTIAKWVEKGQVLYVEGRLQTRKWEAKDGSARYTTEVIGDNCQFGSKPGGKNTVARGDEPADEAPDTINIDGEITDEEMKDLPF